MFSVLLFICYPDNVLQVRYDNRSRREFSSTVVKEIYHQEFFINLIETTKLSTIDQVHEKVFQSRGEINLPGNVQYLISNFLHSKNFEADEKLKFDLH